MDTLARARARCVAPSTAARVAPGGPLLAASWPLQRRRCPDRRRHLAENAADAAAPPPPMPTPTRRALPLLRRPMVVVAASASAAAPTPTAAAPPARKQAKAASRPANGYARLLLLSLAPPALLSAAFLLAAVCWPGAASASEGVVALSGAGLEVFEAFLDYVASLGIWGPVAFVGTVMCAEMIPLFPTQPLALSSGLLFGGQWGAVYQLLAVTLAAGNAFLVARTVGRSLAERVIRAELGHAGTASEASGQEEGDGAEGAAGASASASASSAAAGAPAAGDDSSVLARATRAIEEGGPLKQLTAVMLLRLTPVVPYSASNYLLGLTPIAPLPYLAGTVVGMTPWTVLYASIGGASRRLLQRGVSVELLMQDLSERAARVSGDAAGAVAAVAAAAAGAYAVSQFVLPRLSQRPEATGGVPGSAAAEGAAAGAAGAAAAAANAAAAAAATAAAAAAGAAAAAAATEARAPAKAAANQTR